MFGGSDPSPSRGGVFASLGNLISSLQERFFSFVEKLDAQFDRHAWLDIGRIINEALPQHFEEADKELESESENEYGGYEAATAFDDYSDFRLVFSPPAGGRYQQRKVFVSYLDALEYLRTIYHLEALIYYDNFYVLYVGESK